MEEKKNTAMQPTSSEQEQFETKYMRDIQEYMNAYFYSLITEIYVGVGVNLGLSSKDAYRMAKSKPGELQKANFFKNIFDKFKGIFSYKVPKFRYKKKIYGDGKPMTPKQWDKFNAAIDRYWRDNSEKVSEDMAIKSYMLGRDTTEYREKKKPYKRKSLFQVDFDQYDGDMPSSIAEAYKNYDFTNSEKKIINKSYSNIAMYVTQTNNDIKEAIRQNVEIGIDNNKSPVEIASDLYWSFKDSPVREFTAEAQRRDWNRIASTEMASVYEAAVLAPYESKAMESMKDPEKAQYFVRTGGTCEYCLSVRGTIVRLIPRDIADISTESLRSIGIKDPNTDIYIYTGKNNIGRKRKDWQVCCPAHPYNKATFVPIDPGEQEYNQKTDDVEYKPKKERFVPQMKDYSDRSREEKKDRKPKDIGGGKVQYNNNVYVAVDPDEYNTKLEESRKNPSLPIPVNKNSPSYRRIFGEAE